MMATRDRDIQELTEKVTIACEWSNELLALVRAEEETGVKPLVILASGDKTELHRFKAMWQHFLEKPDGPTLVLLHAFDQDAPEAVAEYLGKYKSNRRISAMGIRIAGRSARGLFSGFTNRMEINGYREALAEAGLPTPVIIELAPVKDLHNRAQRSQGSGQA